MRINIYTEEFPADKNPQYEIVTAKYISSRTGKDMTNYGLRIYLKSHDDLHYIPGRDDDRSAVTFWCGADLQDVTRFVLMLEDTCSSYFPASL